MANQDLHRENARLVSRVSELQNKNLFMISAKHNHNIDEGDFEMEEEEKI